MNRKDIDEIINNLPDVPEILDYDINRSNMMRDSMISYKGAVIKYLDRVLEDYK
jgi:hypothetical protein